MRYSLTLAGLAAMTPAVYGVRAKNFIYVVPDGYGQASQTLGRDYFNIMNGIGSESHPVSSPIGADPLSIGTVRTQASDNLITDSAASGTAFSCGIKTYNGAISVDDDGLPVGSVLEAAHRSGYKTGLVVTSRITHATPAVYAAHVLDRDSENEIAAQQIGYSHPFGSVVDLLMGGGRRHYLPSSEGGRRSDGVNLINWAKDNKWTYVSNRTGLDAVLDDGGKVPLPFLGLYSSDHLAYEIDRDAAEQPSLLNMTRIALDTLEAATAKSCKGYFIMIEASRIDHAGHANDAAAHIHDVLMYNDVMHYLKSFIDAHPQTQLLSAADHECGGLTMHDSYKPTAFAAANLSTERLASLYNSYAGSDKDAYLRDTLLPAYGLGGLSDADKDTYVSKAKASGISSLSISLGNALASVGGLSWTSQGHSAVDVTLYAYADADTLGPLRQQFAGNKDNTQLALYIAEALKLDLDATTAALRANGTSWVVRRDVLEKAKRKGKRSAHDHEHEHEH